MMHPIGGYLSSMDEMPSSMDLRIIDGSKARLMESPNHGWLKIFINRALYPSMNLASMDKTFRSWIY